MPEGDTIHRTANRLRPALEGQELVRFDAPRLTGDRPRIGETIEAVEAVGKHLLVRFPKRLVLHTHMQMTGSWHLYQPGERWQEAAHLARVEIEVADWVAVCFAAPTVRTWRDIDGQPNPLAHLGPDLCLPDVDLELTAERFAQLIEPATTIAEALLDQRVAAGIGNVFKSEVLWAERVWPFTPAAAIDTDTVRRLYRTAARQLQANLTTAVRTTVPGGLAVYGRQRQSCHRCRRPVTARSHGDQNRATYWCEQCQSRAARSPGRSD